MAPGHNKRSTMPLPFLAVCVAALLTPTAGYGLTAPPPLKLARRGLAPSVLAPSAVALHERPVTVRARTALAKVLPGPLVVRRWRRVAKVALVVLAIVGAAVLFADPASAAGGSSSLVAQSVIDAAAEARMSCRPNSLYDRIITDHIALVTTTLRTKQAAQYKAMRNIASVTFSIIAVSAIAIKYLIIRSEQKLKEQEVELFGEFRSSSAEMLEDEDEDRDGDDADEFLQATKEDIGGGPPKKKPPKPADDE